MLTPPERRPGAADVLKHPWMKASTDRSRDITLSLNFSQLKTFQSHEKLKKTVLTYIATQLSEREIGDLRRLFEKFDVNGDGILTFDELRSGLVGVNDKTAKEIHAVFDSLDTDKNGFINYTEFLAATIEKSTYMKEEKLSAAFRLFDKNGDGKITPEELKSVLGRDEVFKGVDQGYWEQLIREADLDGDGSIDYREFISMMDNVKSTRLN
eukprot:TRINITY_DN4259_c0_g1_i1.p2 TRINITY_DN4259_c0_g1~~TRINITY_DN4259_c0_g1_i1.p2  ORF type:complete len:211 (-),score=44.33 TRINITY_DN4259_c0_g1_i1:113-745(-)